MFAILACGNATYEYFHLCVYLSCIRTGGSAGIAADTAMCSRRQSKMNRQIGFVQVNAISQAFWGLLVGLVAAGTICVLVAQS